MFQEPSAMSFLAGDTETLRKNLKRRLKKDRESIRNDPAEFYGYVHDTLYLMLWIMQREGETIAAKKSEPFPVWDYLLYEHGRIVENLEPAVRCLQKILIDIGARWRVDGKLVENDWWKKQGRLP